MDVRRANRMPERATTPAQAAALVHLDGAAVVSGMATVDEAVAFAHAMLGARALRIAPQFQATKDRYDETAPLVAAQPVDHRGRRRKFTAYDEHMAAHNDGYGLRPKHQILGSELAGEVVDVGSAVSKFRVGDRVFGSSSARFGAHAEFLCVDEDGALATMPDDTTFEAAACAGDGAILALTFLRRVGARPGQRLVIYGASSAIGTAAVQLAKHFRAEVTAVCSTKDLAVVKGLGADVVVDDTQDDFTTNGEIYDVVFDAVGKHSFRRCRRSLTRRGMYAGTDLGFFRHTPVLGWITRRGLSPVIDRCYPLEDVVEATRYVAGIKDLSPSTRRPKGRSGCRLPKAGGLSSATTAEPAVIVMPVPPLALSTWYLRYRSLGKPSSE